MADRTVRVRVVADMPGLAAQMKASAAAVGTLGEAAGAAGRGVRTLGADAEAAKGGLAGLAAGAKGGAAGLTEAEAAAIAAGRGIKGASGESEAARGAFGRIGEAARSGLGSLKSAAASAFDQMKGLGLLLAGGAIIYGLHDIVHQGNEYTDSMNKFLEVTRASGAQMRAAGAEAQALGSDMKLPSASAAEAADAMVELAKAGLSAQDAITATRGTIQLAAAARTDVATAAKIEGDALDQFGLKAKDATVVADTLANVANNTSGELTDLAYALKYVGPVAHGMGISIQDATTAIGLLGKSGIIGETAGTALRSALVNMSHPTKQAAQGLKELGIQAFDSQGNFRGLEYVVGALSDAQKHMTTQQFTAAAAMAFGKPALSAMVALAHQGTANFDQMALAVGRSGGAAALAAAESKGLGGAMRGLGKEIASAFLDIYLAVAPGLEKVTRGMTSAVSSAIPAIKDGIRIATDLWDIYGPGVEKKLAAAGAGIEKEAASFADPLKAALAGLATASVPLAISSVEALGKTFGNLEAAVGPAASGLHAAFSSVTSGAGALSILTGRLQVGVGLLGAMSGVLRPIGTIVGDLGHAFAALPGPIQLSVLSMLALRPFRPQIQGMQTAVANFGRAGINAFRGIGDASLYQRVLAAGAGQELGRFGGYVAALEARSVTLRNMGNAFRGVTSSIDPAASGVARFGTVLRGIGTAGAVGAVAGVKGAFSGLVNVLGGPWGVAIGAAMVGLDMLAKRQQEAAQAAAEHQQRISSLTQALQQSSGAIDGNVRAQAVQTLADAKLKDGKTQLLDVMHQAGVTTTQLTDAYLGQGGSVQSLQQRLTQAANANRTWVASGRGATLVYNQQGEAYAKAADALKTVDGEVPAAIAKQKDLSSAVKGSGSAALDATNPTGRLQQAIKTLGDSESDADTKAHALHDALKLLSGGELDVEAAVANQNQALLDLNSSYKDGVDKTQGWGKALLQADGSLNTVSQNGQTLWTKLQGLNEQTAGAAQATYDYARANGTAVPQALKQAETAMQNSWQAAVTAGEKYGLTADQAKNLANQMGFIPSSLAITMSTPGLDDTQKGLLFVQGLADHMPKGSTIKVAALTDQAVKDLESVGIKVKTLPGGRQMLISAPTAKAQAALDALIAKKIPDKTVTVDPKTAAALAALEAVKQKLAGVPAGKTITVAAPPAEAISALESVGFKVRTLPNRQIAITVPTGGAFNSASAIQGAINSVHGKTVTVTVQYQGVGSLASAGVGVAVPGGRYADGGIVHAADGLFVPGYGPRRDIVPAVLSPGEGVLVPETVRKLGMLTGYGPAGIIKALNAWGRYGAVMRFADGGMVAGGGVQHFASGGFTYTPTSAPALGGTSEVFTSYNNQLKSLQDAWKNFDAAMGTHHKAYEAVLDAERHLRDVRSHRHTYLELANAEQSLTKARRADADATAKANAAYRSATNADAAFGEAAGVRPSGFDLRGYGKQLADSVAATNAWRSNLDAVGKRAGSDVQAILEGMGQDGAALTAALAKASKKDFDTIVANLKALQGTATATLADFDKQLDASNARNAGFASDLQALAARGYGNLAQQLASQGDQAAMDLAHQAASASDRQLAGLNSDLARQQQILSGNDLANALVVLSTLRAKPGAGFADLLGAGLDMATLQSLIPKMIDKVNQLPAAYRTEFLREWAGQNGVTAMAQGGILRQPTVLAGEAGPEAYIPLNGSARSRQLLGTTAALMGYQLMPARAFAPVVITPPPGPAHVDQSRTIHLHGARQTAAEQAADLMRHMVALG